MNPTAKRDDALLEKALEMSGIDRELVTDHGYIRNLIIDDVNHVLKQRAYVVFVKCAYPLSQFPIIFFFDEEESKSE